MIGRDDDMRVPRHKYKYVPRPSIPSNTTRSNTLPCQLDVAYKLSPLRRATVSSESPLVGTLWERLSPVFRSPTRDGHGPVPPLCLFGVFTSAARPMPKLSWQQMAVVAYQGNGASHTNRRITHSVIQSSRARPIT